MTIPRRTRTAVPDRSSGTVGGAFPSERSAAGGGDA